jgi:hypothetical protein
MNLVEIADDVSLNPDYVALVEQDGTDVLVYLFLGNKMKVKRSKYSYTETVERLIHGEGTFRRVIPKDAHRNGHAAI